MTSILRLTGQSGTEVTGLCLDPSGTRLYMSSQRGINANRGITYEITGPFRRRFDRLSSLSAMRSASTRRFEL